MTAKTKHPMTFTLPSEREILVTRVFDAPAKLIFEAHTECEHMRRWVGPRGTTLAVCDNDCRVGGAYRFVYRSGDGGEVAFHGEYLEVVPHTRLVTTEVYEGAPEAGAAVNTLVLEERDGQTTMTLSMVYPTQEARDMAAQSGMDYGMREGYERLDELIEEIG
jgi:uncharacterized protein YndB with AHSA1/START domain